MLVASIGVAFVQPYANFSDEVAPLAGEWDGNSGWIAVARRAILERGEIPLWNHHMGTGLPYLGDPLSHLFSPLAILPALALGAEDGPRLAMVLTIIASGLTQYYLGVVLGLSAPARVFGAVIYMMNGHMLARFDTGHFDFGLAYPYMPLCLAFVYQSVRSRRIVFPILGGFSLAGLLFTGNAYYFLFWVIGLGVAGAAFVVVSSHPPFINVAAAGRLALMAAIGAGASAIQWMAWLATEGFINKGSDAFLTGSPTLPGAVRTLFESRVSFYARDPGFGMEQGFPAEYYSYIGIFLVPLFVVSPLAVLTRHCRTYLTLAALAVVYLLWASAGHTVFGEVYEMMPRLYDFRWTSRQIGVAMPLLVTVPAYGLEVTWRVVRQYRPGRGRLQRVDPKWIRRGLLLLIAAYASLAVADVFHQNRSVFHYAPLQRNKVEIARWLAAAREPKPYLFWQVQPVWGAPVSYQQEGAKLYPLIWAWQLGHNETPVARGEKPVLLRPLPRYILQPERAKRPAESTVVATIAGQVVLESAAAPPYAGFVNQSESLSRPQAFEQPAPGEFAPWPFADVTTAAADWPSTNEVRVRGAPADTQDTILVLESYLPGWRLEVDGRDRGDTFGIGGMLAAEALPGHHEYLFVFDPAYARQGAIVSVTSTVFSIGLISFSPMKRIAARISRRIARR